MLSWFAKLLELLRVIGLNIIRRLAYFILLHERSFYLFFYSW
jgi:hypothetical protein